MLLITLKICCWKLEVKYWHLFTAVRLSYTFRYYNIRAYVRSYTYAFCPKPNDMISDDEIDRGKPSSVDSGQFLLSPVSGSSSNSSISHNNKVRVYYVRSA